MAGDQDTFHLLDQELEEPVENQPNTATGTELTVSGLTENLYELQHRFAPLSAPTTSRIDGIGGPLALRALHDALALQLARRGFDGLRRNALALLTELTAAFIRAIGTQLQLVNPSPMRPPVPIVPLVLRLQCHSNLRSVAEWRRLQTLFARRFEPLHGSSATTIMRQKQHCHGGTVPHAVEQLYTMMRASWHYKQTPAGRTAHAQSGAAEAGATGATAPTSASGPILSEVIFLKRKTAERSLVESWLGTAERTTAAPAPLLLPGVSRAHAKAVSTEASTGKKRKKAPSTA